MASANPSRSIDAPARGVLAVPRSWQLADRCFAFMCQSAALVVVAIFVALVAVLAWKALPVFTQIGPAFLTSTVWDPVQDHRQFGALAFIYGTLATSFIAMLIAVPLGVGTAAFLSEIAPPWLRSAGSLLVEMLAAIPSVVYGFWGLFVLAPAVQALFTALGGPNQGGFGILSAGIVLAIMIVPYIAAVSFDVCRAVPTAQREAAYALGATRWQTIWRVVIPYARPGIFGGCFLALGRALGETMAVTMLIGNVPEIQFSLFAKGDSIPSVIANQFTAATYDLYLSALVALGLLLLVVSMAVNSLARLLIWRMKQPAKVGWWAPLLALAMPRPERATDSTALVKIPEIPSAPTPGPALQAAGPADRTRVPPLQSSSKWNAAVNAAMTAALGLCLAITLGFLLFIFGYLLVQGTQALNWAFFVNTPVPVGEPGGGMANALFGSFMLVGLASAFAIPVGILAAVYLAEYRSDRLGPVVRFVGELLTGVPSIVIGIFGYYLVVRPMGHLSGWAGAFALAVIMVPIVMRATEEALRIVPASLRHASYALGASKWQTVVKVTLPAALPAIITAVFLAIARVVGETAPLILTAGSNTRWPSSPGDATPSLPYFIWTYATSGYPDWQRQAWAAALVLLTVVMVLSFGIRLITGRRAMATRQAG